jgi:two-component system sensor histidine kinase LytS
VRAEAVVPLRFSRGDARLILLGRRPGGRRYLSLEFESLARMGSAIVDGVERLREREMQTLVAEAEFRALQSQINPHFLFNALNAIYGTIPKDSREARQAVLNLSEMLRYCLRPENALAPLSKELDIVKAYLEIEALRLGERLETEIAVEGEISQVRAPALSIQPLAENAVKHGIANKPGKGKVTVRVERKPTTVRIQVIDTGGIYPGTAGREGGMGLANVRRRLQLCFGPGYDLHISSGQGQTVAWFEVPVETQAARTAAGPVAAQADR